MDPDTDHEDSGAETDDSKEFTTPDPSDAEDSPEKVAAKEKARHDSLAKLQSGANSPGTSVSPPASPLGAKHRSSGNPPQKAQAKIKRRTRNGPDAVIVLKEERVSIL